MIQVPPQYLEDVSQGRCLTTMDAYLEHEADRTLYRNNLLAMDKFIRQYSKAGLEYLLRAPIPWAMSLGVSLNDFKVAVTARILDFETMREIAR